MVHEKLLQSLRDMMAAEEARLETSAAMKVRTEPFYPSLIFALPSDADLIRHDC